MAIKKKLFLLDSYALIYRAFFAFAKNPRVNSKGIDTSAVFGFANTLIEIINTQSPTHIAAVFDTSAPTFRHKDFPEYKAHRDPTPEGIIQARPYIDKLLEAMNISKLYVDGYEADDVIGTLSKKAEGEGFEVYMMTSDKDFAQLVSENIFIYRPGNKWSPNEIWGVKEVLDKFKINNVSQVIDFLGMMGDAADNIPGINGVGKKTAQKFLAEYGSMEGLYENTHKIKGKMREKVENSKKQALLSKKLARIIVDVPIEFHQEDLKAQEFNRDKITELFQELEFKTILKRILTVDEKTKVSETMEVNKKNENSLQLNMFSDNKRIKEKEIKNYQIGHENFEDLYKIIDEEKKCSIQLISNDLSDFQSEIIGISIAIHNGEIFYFPFSNKLIKFIKKIFQSETILKIGFNIKEQAKILSSHNIDVSHSVFDISIAHYLLHPDQRHDIGLLSENYLGREMFNLSDLLGKGKNTKKIDTLAEKDIMFYACELTETFCGLFHIFSEKLKQRSLTSLFYEIEMPLISVLTKMEIEGINLDVKMLSDFSTHVLKDIKLLAQKIHKISGETFNISSPKQMGEVLFEKMRISNKVKKTKTGQYSTSEETLTKLKGSHEIIDQILSYRSLEKLQSTYIKALPILVNKTTDRIHTTFNQAVAATGRLSSINPNLQNIPIRTENGRKIRMAFVSRNKEYQILAADYSQIELRIMASLSGDEVMTDAFNKNKDIHLSTASKVYQVPENDVSREMRSNAKMVNFGIIYGISPFGLSQRLGIKRQEASAIIDQYFLEFKGVKDYINKSIEKARRDEYVETIFGRKRYLKEINAKNAMLRGFAERNAINAPIQGSAADIIKQAMIDIQLEIDRNNLKSKLLLQVHDELVFDLHNSEKQIFVDMVKEKMENAIRIEVQLVVDIGVGINWLDAR